MAKVVLAVIDVMPAPDRLTTGKVLLRELDEFVIGVENPQRVTVPPGILHGFTSVGSTQPVILVNVPDIAYNRTNPDEFRFAIDTVQYDWRVKNR